MIYSAHQGETKEECSLLLVEQRFIFMFRLHLDEDQQVAKSKCCDTNAHCTVNKTIGIGSTTELFNHYIIYQSPHGDIRFI